jgi:hypothetical protein
VRSVLAGNIRYAGTPAAVNYAESKLFDDDTNTVWCSADNALPVFLDVFFDVSHPHAPHFPHESTGAMITPHLYRTSFAHGLRVPYDVPMDSACTGAAADKQLQHPSIADRDFLRSGGCGRTVVCGAVPIPIPSRGAYGLP